MPGTTTRRRGLSRSGVGVLGYGGGGSRLADLSVFVEVKARVGLCRALSSCSSIGMAFGEILVVEWSI